MLPQMLRIVVDEMDCAAEMVVPEHVAAATSTSHAGKEGTAKDILRTVIHTPLVCMQMWDGDEEDEVGEAAVMGDATCHDNLSLNPR